MKYLRKHARPRLCGRQQHRSNADTEDGSVEGYYRVNLTVPFLDYLLAEFRSRCIKQINLLLSFIFKKH